MKAASLLVLLLWQGSAANRPHSVQPDGLRYERAIRVAGVGVPENENPVGQKLGSKKTGDENPGDARQACAVLDAPIFPHAAPSLSDLRIYPVQSAQTGWMADRGTASPVPYAITVSEAASEETQPARVLNLGMGSGDASHSIVFDLEMPARAYTAVTLDLDPAVHDFIATATVSGSDSLTGGKSAALGSFTLFDLTSQHLSRDTTIPLEESKYKYLHVRLSVSSALGISPASGRSLAPGDFNTPGNTRRSGLASTRRFDPAMVLGAQVPSSREAETVYTTVAQTAVVANVGRETVAAFTVPARVPVERVSFVLAPGFTGNFSRMVRVTARAEAADSPGQPGSAATNSHTKVNAESKEDDHQEDNNEDIADGEDKRAPLLEVVTGSILRVHANQAGREIDTEQLAVPAVLGANLQRTAKVEVAIENGNQPPLPIVAVRLQMRQRKICFNVPAGTATDDGSGRDSGLALFYGDRDLTAPQYDDAQRFVESRIPLVAELGPEKINPYYRTQPAQAKPFAASHPDAFWIVLIVAIWVLGLVAMRSKSSV